MDAIHRAQLLSHLVTLSALPTSPCDSNSGYPRDRDADIRLLRDLRNTVDRILELSPPCSPHTPAKARTAGEEAARATAALKAASAAASPARELSPPSSPAFQSKEYDVERWDRRDQDRIGGVAEEEPAAEEDMDECMEEEEPMVDPERRFQRLSEILANLQAQAEAAVYGQESDQEDEYLLDGHSDTDGSCGEYTNSDVEDEEEFYEPEEEAVNYSEHATDGPNDDRNSSEEVDWRSLPSRPETRLEMRHEDPCLPESDDERETTTNDHKSHRTRTFPSTTSSTSIARREQEDYEQQPTVHFSHPLTPPSSTGPLRRRRRTRQRVHRPSDQSKDVSAAQLHEKVHEVGITGTMDVLPVSSEDEIERLLVELLRTGETEVLMFRVVWMWMGSLGIVWMIVGWMLGWGRPTCVC